LLNATFGNAAELIIGVLALRRGLTDLVKASLTGSIIGNILLVFGLCAFVGGLKISGAEVQPDRREHGCHDAAAERDRADGAGAVSPAVARQAHHRAEGRYRDRRGPFPHVRGKPAVHVEDPPRLVRADGSTVTSRDGSAWPAMATLAAATAGVAWMSELLVGGVSDAAQALGMSNLFVGVVVVAIIGNAAEHFSAVLMAARNDMDAAIGIAVGSSAQIALFVAPLLIFASYAIAACADGPAVQCV
jgi:Ca2+:H+ antiporter